MSFAFTVYLETPNDSKWFFSMSDETMFLVIKNSLENEPLDHRNKYRIYGAFSKSTKQYLLHNSSNLFLNTWISFFFKNERILCVTSV